MIVSRLREESVKVFASEGMSEKRSRWKHWKHHNPHWQQFRTRDTRRHWTTLDNITTLYQTLPEVQQTQAIDCLSGLTRRWTLNMFEFQKQTVAKLLFAPISPASLFPTSRASNKPLAALQETRLRPSTECDADCFHSTKVSPIGSNPSE